MTFAAWCHRPLEVKPCENPDWAVDEFQWSAPVGGMERVADFLEFRRERIGKLIEERNVASRADHAR